MDDWRNTILKPTDTMGTAVRVLEENRLIGIGLVLDGSQRLLGTITDGDIRRALLDKRSMDTVVTEIMNREPAIAKWADDKTTIYQTMRKHFVTTVPIITDDRVVVGIERSQYIAPQSIQKQSVMLMAGGFGKRLYPLTQDKPKPLLTVGEKPILQIMFERLLDQGFNDFFISLHYKADMIKHHFGDGSAWGATIQYLNEKTPLGTAGALSLLPINELTYPLIVVNGDLMTQVDYNRVISFHREQRAIATVGIREHGFDIPYGVVDIEDGEFVRIVEKPTYRCFVNAGIYAFEKKFIDGISKDQPLDMPELLKLRKSQGIKVDIFPIHEYWLDIGRKTEYQRAQEDVAP